MNKTVREAMDACLSGLTWKADKKQAVLRMLGGKSIMKKKLSAGLVLVIVLVLAAVTALAITLSDHFFKQAAMLQNERGNLENWSMEEKLGLIDTMVESGVPMDSDKYHALQQAITDGSEHIDRLCNEILVESKIAQEALKENYHFSSTTFSFFRRSVSFENGNDPENAVWIVSYAPQYHQDEIGSYEVQVRAATGEVLHVGWTHDGAVLENVADNWHAPVWNAALVDRLLTFDAEHARKREERENVLGEYDTWTLEQKAGLDRTYLETGFPTDDHPVNVLPGVQDVTEDEAIRFAIACLSEAYGIDAQLTSTVVAFRVEVRLRL